MFPSMDWQKMDVTAGTPDVERINSFPLGTNTLYLSGKAIIIIQNF